MPANGLVDPLVHTVKIFYNSILCGGDKHRQRRAGAWDPAAMGAVGRLEAEDTLNRDSTRRVATASTLSKEDTLLISRIPTACRRCDLPAQLACARRARRWAEQVDVVDSGGF